jgi:hypothetical protein
MGLNRFRASWAKAFVSGATVTFVGADLYLLHEGEHPAPHTHADCHAFGGFLQPASPGSAVVSGEQSGTLPGYPKVRVWYTHDIPMTASGVLHALAIPGK